MQNLLLIKLKPIVILYFLQHPMVLFCLMVMLYEVRGYNKYVRSSFAFYILQQYNELAYIYVFLSCEEIFLFMKIMVLPLNAQTVNRMRLVYIHGMITPNQMVLQRGINYMINIIRCDIYLSSTTNLFPYQLIFVNYFYEVQNQYILFWLLKDAQLTCNRCPLRPLLTPF